jgi:hypothetical protein
MACINGAGVIALSSLDARRGVMDCRNDLDEYHTAL